MKIYKHYFILIMVCVVLTLCVLCVPNTANMLPFLGIALIVSSIWMLVIIHDKENLSFLFAILMICNFVISFSNYLSYKKYAFSWQNSIAGTSEHVVLAKAFLVFFLIICCTVLLVIKSEDSYSFCDSMDIGINKSNIIFWGGLTVLFLILIFGFDRTSTNGYVPATNALYEYAIVIYLFVWLMSPVNKKYRYPLIVYSILYILQGLIFGDRSSAFPMIILVYIMIQNRKIRMVNLCVLSVLGILGANVIGIVRSGFGENESLFVTVLNRMLYVDSISYSFYSGIQIIRARSSAGNLMNHFQLWMKTLFSGGSGKADLAVYVAKLSSDFFNRGGGTSSAYFYFWGRFLGVIIGGIIIGIFIGKIYKKKGGIFSVLQILIIVFALRWYVYFPNVFFRSCIIVPCTLFFILNVMNKVLLGSRVK